MPDHKIGTREEWLAARLELLEAEKALTRRGDELEQQQRSGVFNNFRPWDPGPPPEGESPVGTDWATYMLQSPGMSAFALEDGVVYHTYSAYARGLDGLWGMYQWLDRAPLGRNETDLWFRRHDEYDSQ